MSLEFINDLFVTFPINKIYRLNEYITIGSDAHMVEDFRRRLSGGKSFIGIDWFAASYLLEDKTHNCVGSIMKLKDIQPWELLMKRSVWLQLGKIAVKRILDFASLVVIISRNEDYFIRNEKTMYNLFMDVANADDKIVAVYMNDSRTNENIPKDIFQDYDIVFLCERNRKLYSRQEINL